MCIRDRESSDEDTIRMDIAGTEVLTLTNSAMTLKGTTPTLTIGDAGAEDTKIVFDGNAQDYYIGLDDSADDLIIGKGSAVGTTPAVVIDENLNVGIGVTPSTIWSTSYDALQIGIGGSISAHSSAGDALKIGSNFVYEGTAPNYYDKYLTTSTAHKYELDADGHKWFYAASGTAGNAISWSEAMRITSSGVVDIKSGGSASTPSLIFEGDTDTGFFHGTNVLAIATAGSERLRINDSGHLMLGKTNSSVSNAGTYLGATGSSFFTLNSTGAVNTLHVYDEVDSAYSCLLYTSPSPRDS